MVTPHDCGPEMPTLLQVGWHAKSGGPIRCRTMSRWSRDAQTQQFAEAVRDFAAQHHSPEAPPTREAWRAAGELGLTGLQIPEEFGGSDAASYRIVATAVSELATISHGLSSTFTVSCDIATAYLVRYGNTETKQRWLPALAAGEAIAALALTEPGAGSDLAALTTRATAVDNGWSLTGTKTFITNGSIADVVVVAARTSDQHRGRGVSLFAVDTSLQGVSRHALVTAGHSDCDTGELAFHEVILDNSSLLGVLDEGLFHLLERLPQERLTSSVANLAQARDALELTLQFAKSREAFGSTIGSLQHNAFRLAEVDAQLAAVEALVDRCIDDLDANVMSSADGARAKLLSARVENAILDLGYQLHGGSAFLADAPIHRRWVDGRITRVWAGADEVMLHLIAQDLGLHP